VDLGAGAKPDALRIYEDRIIYNLPLDISSVRWGGASIALDGARSAWVVSGASFGIRDDDGSLYMFRIVDGRLRLMRGDVVVAIFDTPR
jgi:hypothetical protein